MSHCSIEAVWTQLEKRSDLTTILRDAIGQYAIQTALCSKNYPTEESIQAFNQLISTIHTAFHLQRTYLQSREPSPNIESSLVDPSFVIEIIIFLLDIKDACIPAHGDLGSVEEKVLRSIGVVLLAGLRLLTLQKSKLVLPSDLHWSLKADLLKSKLANWPLANRVHRFLVGELCMRFLQKLSTSTEPPIADSIKALCKRHHDYPRTRDDADLPDFLDSLVGIAENSERLI